MNGRANPGQLSGVTNMVGNLGFMSDKDWRCGKYGPLGLIETLLKLIGIVAAFLSLQLYDPDENRLVRLTESKIGLIVVFMVLGVLEGFLIFFRIVEKELCAIVFSLFTFTAHWIMVLILFTSGDPSEYVLIFGIMFMWGCYAKIIFLRVEDEFEVHMLDRDRLFALTYAQTLLYLGIVVLQSLSLWLDFPVIS